MLVHAEITKKIIGAAIEVHRQLGPGLLETAYEECLFAELRDLKLRIERQLSVPLRYKKVFLDCGFRLDLLIENSVIVELKAVEETLPIHEAQLLTYMRLAKKRVGLLINFNKAVLRDGIVRRVL